MRASVSQMLGITAKRANRALATFQARHGIREALEQRGKAQIKVRCPVFSTDLVDAPSQGQVRYP